MERPHGVCVCPCGHRRKCSKCFFSVLPGQTCFRCQLLIRIWKGCGCVENLEYGS